jgi:soluble lytic murein transglycosylase-like protein
MKGGTVIAIKFFRALAGAVVVALTPAPALAQTPLAQTSCWEEAGASQAIDPTLLKAIAWKESHGHKEAVGPVDPKTGHRAFGMMQVYSVHLPKLAEYGITKQHLFEPCTNQKVGAWILADCIQRFGKTWKAVGCYYTGPASKNIAAQTWYVKDVQAYYAGYKRQEQAPAGQPASQRLESPIKRKIPKQAPPEKPITPAPSRIFERVSGDSNS